MRKTLALLASAALMGLTLAAHADTIFSINNGTTAGGGTYSGSYSLNTATDIIDGGSFTLFYAALPYDSETFTFVSGSKGSTFTIGNFTSGADSFSLLTTSSTTTPVLCSSSNFGTCSISFSQFQIQNKGVFVSGGTVSAYVDPVAATPEPSSLALLGTGILGVFGAARRRFLKA